MEKPLIESSWEAGNPEALALIAAEILAVPVSSKIYLLDGEMGAGKTTLTGNLIRALGSTDQVQSPTYGLVHEYTSQEGPIYHFDFYRIKTDAEALDIGLEEYLDSGAYCFIEWAEKIDRLLPRQYNRLSISLESGDLRRIVLTGQA